MKNTFISQAISTMEKQDKRIMELTKELKEEKEFSEQLIDSLQGQADLFNFVVDKLVGDR